MPLPSSWWDIDFSNPSRTSASALEEELVERRGDESVTLEWLGERLRDFVDLNPEFETPIERFATWLARLDDEDDE